MRILAVNIHLPDAERGGGWTLAHRQLESLVGEGHHVTLVTGGLGPGETAPALEQLGVEVQGVTWRPHPNPRGVRLLAAALRGPGSRRFRTVAPAVAALGQAANALEQHAPYDVALVTPGEIAPVVAALRTPTALYLPDCYTVQVQRARREEPSAKQRLLAAIEAPHVRRWERTRYREASALAAVSSTEADALAAITGRTVDVVPIVVDDGWFVPPDRPRHAGLVAIVAALDYRPNIDAVQWFTTAVWPRVRASEPSAHLRVVGRRPGDGLRAAVAAAGGELCADVPDIRLHYWEASVVAVPLRLGSGVKTKVAHAMACRTPVVGTPVAFEGMDVADGDQALVRADPVDLAEAIVATLRNPTAAAARAERARQLVERYRSPVAGAALLRFLEQAAGAAR